MRLIRMHHDLLDGECIALSFSANERLSVEPDYRLELVSPDPDLDLDALLGTSVDVDIDLDGGKVRRFRAHVLGAQDTGQLGDRYTYAFDLGSWLSFLSEQHNCRIFQGLNVPQIVESIFVSRQCADFRFELESEYDVREYCVQFRESDLDFVKRLLEDEGIHFRVECEDGRDTVIVSDAKIFADLDEPYDRLRFLPDGEEHRALRGREGVQRLRRQRRLRSGRVTLRDFDYRSPAKDLDVDARSVQADTASAALEFYDYAAGYRDCDRGERLAKIRLDAIAAEAGVLDGQANVRGIAIGRGFTLEGHPDEGRNRRYQIVGCALSFVQDGPDSTSQGRNVSCRFDALADDQPFHPICTTPRPAVPGIHSATVVGPEGSEVHTDRMGRIRVHFHWDRYTRTEEDASCWIRVAQPWNGKGWGVLALPRVGQEVLVTYVDGDLDRPLVTGSVYNGDNPTPYNLPKDIHYTGIVSRSLKQGQPQHASQLTFDDTRGAERVMIHAERDLQQTVERNSSIRVANDLNSQVSGTSTSVTGISVSITGISVSITGISISYVGISMSHTATSTSYTGKSTSYTDGSISFTGTSDSTTGSSKSVTGTSTSWTGSSVSYTGSSTSYTGYSESVTDTSISRTKTSKSDTDSSFSKTGESTSITETSRSLTGDSSSVTGNSSSVTGSSASVTGISASVTGVSMSATGVSMSTTGTSIAETGTEFTVTGASTTATGMTNSACGVSNSVTGLSISYTGASYSDVGVDLKQLGMQIKQ